MIVYTVVLRPKQYKHEPDWDVHLRKVPQITAASEPDKGADSARQLAVSSNHDGSGLSICGNFVSYVGILAVLFKVIPTLGRVV